MDDVEAGPWLTPRNKRWRGRQVNARPRQAPLCLFTVTQPHAETRTARGLLQNFSSEYLHHYCNTTFKNYDQRKKRLGSGSTTFKIKMEVPPPTSLKTLAANEALKQILQPEFSESQFVSLPPHLQKLLFSKLREEVDRLRGKEDRWRAVVQSCAPADLQLYLRNQYWVPSIKGLEVKPASKGENEVESRKRERNSGELSGYRLRKYFIDRWSYLTEDGETELEARLSRRSRTADSSSGKTARMQWSDWSLYRDPEEGTMKLCEHEEFSLVCSCGPLWNRGLSYQISSQLLLYRLTATFGMPPPRETDRYKSCWDCAIKFDDDDDDSVGRIMDWKGTISLSFEGTITASKEFVKLINYIVGYKCLHSYDGIVAGTVA